MVAQEGGAVPALAAYPGSAAEAEAGQGGDRAGLRGVENVAAPPRPSGALVVRPVPPRLLKGRGSALSGGAGR